MITLLISLISWMHSHGSLELIPVVFSLAGVTHKFLPLPLSLTNSWLFDLSPSLDLSSLVCLALLDCSRLNCLDDREALFPAKPLTDAQLAPALSSCYWAASLWVVEDKLRHLQNRPKSSLQCPVSLCQALVFLSYFTLCCFTWGMWGFN